MADTNHAHESPGFVEGDGISYSGIVWFIAILTGTTLFCQALVWGMFQFLDYRVTKSDAPRAPLAATAGTKPPEPNLLVDEPANLRRFRHDESTMLATYGWINKDFGTLHIPIEVAKEKLLQKGLPVRPPAAPAAAAPAVAKTSDASARKGGR
jgi:hypothetical protein